MQGRVTNLFRGTEIDGVLQNKLERALSKARCAQITFSKAQELIESLVHEAMVDPPRIVGEYVQSSDPVEINGGSLVEFSAPCSGDPHMMLYDPIAGPIPGPTCFYEGGRIGYEIRIINREQFEKEKCNIERSIKGKLHPITYNCERHNESLLEPITTVVQKRVAELDAKRSVLEELGITLQSRPLPPDTFDVPIVRKSVSLQAEPANARPGTPEYFLSDTSYGEVLDRVRSIAKVFERSPGAFSKLSEEQLRFLLLVPLNAQFETQGLASAETFNFSGKTDILIRHNDTNIFIAECKFWSGASALQEAIDQALGYVTVRDSRLCLIIFVRQKGFTSILQKLTDAVSSHPRFLIGPENSALGESRWTLTRNSDEPLPITMDVLCFHLPVELG